MVDFITDHNLLKGCEDQLYIVEMARKVIQRLAETGDFEKMRTVKKSLTKYMKNLGEFAPSDQDNQKLQSHEGIISETQARLQTIT